MNRDLRQQHEAYTRSGYDGHNRQPVGTTMRQLHVRRSRRRARRSLAHLATGWDAPVTRLSA